MYLILLCLGFGIFFGFFLQNKKLKKGIDKIYGLSVYSLLFLMGVSIGQNKEIFSNLGKLGLTALFIAVFSISGSILFVNLANKYILKVDVK